ncbi:MAG: hypothetical protein HOY78_30485 [Saccharothrix sp.]|nr:hypothetical protein [Saccharothrix sp.]
MTAENPVPRDPDDDSARYRAILAANPRDARALRELARATPEDKVDEADHLYRRAAAVDGLTREDHLRWFRMLLLADPPRTLRWLNTVPKLRRRTGREAEEVFADLAVVLAGEDALVAAATVLDAMELSTDLPPQVRHELVLVMRVLFGAKGSPWFGGYSGRKGLLEALAPESFPRTAVRAASIAYDHRDFAYAGTLLNTVGDDPADPVSREADVLRTYIALDEDDYQEVLRRVDPDAADTGRELRLVHAIALHGTGQLDTARRNLTIDLCRTRRPAEAPDDDRARREFRVRALVARAEVHYDRGDFRSCWNDVRAITRLETADLSPSVRAAVIACRCAVDPKCGTGALRELDRLIAADGSGRIALDLVHAEIELGLTARSTRSRTRTEASARATLSRVRIAESALRLPSARPAYAALLVDDDDVARALLPGVAPATKEDWRVSTLRALVLLRRSRPEQAAALLEKVLLDRRHDLDLRCLLVQARLAAGRTGEAVREAASVVEFAPCHVTGRLLYAEALFEVAGEPGAEDHDRLVEAATEYGEALRLHRATTDYLAGRLKHGPVGSSPLPKPLVVHAARRQVVAAVRAMSASGRDGMPVPRSVKRLGDNGVAVLAEHGRRDESKRFSKIVKRVRVVAVRRRWTRRACLAVAPVLVVGAIFGDPLLKNLEPWSPTRLGALVLAALVGFWPSVRKLTVAGVEIERDPVLPDPRADVDNLLKMSVAGPLLVGQLFSAPAQRDPQWQGTPSPSEVAAQGKRAASTARGLSPASDAENGALLPNPRR